MISFSNSVQEDEKCRFIHKFLIIFPFCFSSHYIGFDLYIKSTYTQVVYTVCSMHRPLTFSFIHFISVMSISHENKLKYFAENRY